MSTTPTDSLAWLPPCLDDEDMPTLIEAAYSIFQKELAGNSIIIDGRPLLFSNKMSFGKKEDFFHIIVGGKQSNRAKVPSKVRCRYITWIKPILDKYPSDEVKTWEVERGNSIMKCLAPKDFSFLVVMRVGRTKYFFNTAYPAENPHTLAKWKRDYEDYVEKQRSSNFS